MERGFAVGDAHKSMFKGSLGSSERILGASNAQRSASPSWVMRDVPSTHFDASHGRGAMTRTEKSHSFYRVMFIELSIYSLVAYSIWLITNIGFRRCPCSLGYRLLLAAILRHQTRVFSNCKKHIADSNYNLSVLKTLLISFLFWGFMKKIGVISCFQETSKA